MRATLTLDRWVAAGQRHLPEPKVNGLYFAEMLFTRLPQVSSRAVYGPPIQAPSPLDYSERTGQAR